MTQRQTSTPSWTTTGVPRLYKRVGKKKISWIYKHPDGRSETLASIAPGSREEARKAEKAAIYKAAEIQQGQVVAGSVAEMIDRFRVEVDPTHYLDQSKHGKSSRESAYKNLTAFFGKMHPASMRTVHGYQYLDARAKSGAPARANKEMAQMSTVCNYAIRWGLIEINPFKDLMQNKYDSVVRTVERSQIVRFYLWSIKQQQAYRTMGCAAMFSYLTGFRAAEVRPFPKSGISDAGVFVVGAKRKMGEAPVHKLREWSPRLRCVVSRALQRSDKLESLVLFAATRRGLAYSKSGWSSTWQDAMRAWIQSADATYSEADNLVSHPLYFSLADVRPAAITRKMENRSADVYDFAAHANPATTHKHYDQRKVKRASATE